ncbi:porin family protein [Algibacter sp.]|nr:porin family protein [Algibacter sp.]
MKNSILFFLVAVMFNASSYSQGKIKDAEDSLKKTEQSINSHSNSTYSNNSNDSDSGFLSDIVRGLIAPIFAYTAYGIAFESPFETNNKSHHAFLTKHPYKNSNTGNYTYAWNEDSEIFTTTLTSRFIFETNRLYGNHLNADMRFLKRLGLEFDYLQLWEDNKNFGANKLAIYTVLAKYNRVRTEHFNAYWGLGAAYVDGEVDALGFTYGLGAEYFFVKPFSLEGNFNKVLVNDNSINKFNALLNYHRKQYKFIGGYERLKIGSIKFSNLSLGVGISL